MCNGAPTTSYWSTITELAFTDSEGQCPDRRSAIQRKIETTKVNTLVVLKVKLLFNTIKSYQYCLSGFPGLIILI